MPKAQRAAGGRAKLRRHVSRPNRYAHAYLLGILHRCLDLIRLSIHTTYSETTASFPQPLLSKTTSEMTLKGKNHYDHTFPDRTRTHPLPQGHPLFALSTITTRKDHFLFLCVGVSVHTYRGRNGLALPFITPTQNLDFAREIKLKSQTSLLSQLSQARNESLAKTQEFCSVSDTKTTL